MPRPIRRREEEKKRLNDEDATGRGATSVPRFPESSPADALLASLVVTAGRVPGASRPSTSPDDAKQRRGCPEPIGANLNIAFPYRRAPARHFLRLFRS